MLRWMMPILVATFALTSAAEAVGPAGKSAARRAASQLPAGLPRAHYKFRTTITRATPAPYLRPVYVADRPEVPFTPWAGYVPWSGNWGLPFDYNYQNPWYAGPESSESNLQPYGYGCGYGLYGYGYGYC